VKIPHRKPKGEELSGAQKEYNKKLRSKRVVSEHTMGKMKKYDTITSIVGGFVNFRTMNFRKSIISK